jgi:hypothetical protein
MSPHQLLSKLPALQDRARAAWLDRYPGDSPGADVAASLVGSRVHEIAEAQYQQQSAAFDQATQALNDGANSVAALRSTPEGEAAWRGLSPEGQRAITDRLAHGDRQLDADSVRTFYQLQGQA